MSDDLSDPRDEYEKTKKSIERLSTLARMTDSSERKAEIDREIDRLETYRERLEESFDFTAEDEAVKAEPGGVDGAGEASNYPVLESFRARYTNREELKWTKNPEIKDIGSYALFFEDEYLRLFDKRMLDLDHLSSRELETVYNLFGSLKRRIEIYARETEGIYEAQGADTLKKIKAKQVLFLEVFKFFKRIDGFTVELISDIEGQHHLCFNGNEKITFGPHERNRALSGKTVYAGLLAVHEFSRELMRYLDIPNFKK